jgi:outer membrane protein OmpA-like peptidoglycan-associated protein
MADHGVAEGRLSQHGYGKTDFVATNKTGEGRAQNRRVELVPNQ